MERSIFVLIKTLEKLREEGHVIKEFNMPEGWGLESCILTNSLAKNAGTVVEVYEDYRGDQMYYLIKDSGGSYRDYEIEKIITKEEHPEYFL